MKVRSIREGIAIPMLFAAVLVKDTLVKMTTTNNTVDKAVANDFVLGRVTKPAAAIGGTGTVGNVVGDAGNQRSDLPEETALSPKPLPSPANRRD